MRRSKSLFWTGVVGLAAWGVVGCAPMSVGAPVVTDVPKGSEQRSTANGASDGVLEQDGLRISIGVTDHCDVQRIDKIERTTIREHRNDAPQNDWWAGIGGAVIAGAGALTVADPGRVAPADGSVSQKETRGYGFALIGFGALLLAVPVIDYARVHRVAQHKVEQVEAPGPVVQRDVRCAVPRPGTLVLARYPGGREIPVGATDARGVVEANLDDVTPLDLFFPKDGAITLRSTHGELGQLSLASLYAQREDAAWRLAGSSACNSSLDEDACDLVATYERNYPDGDHVAAARVAIAEARARRRTAADRAAWAALDLAACRTPAKNNLIVIETACGPVAQYITDFPTGEHVDAARDALRPAQAILVRLQAEEERRAAREQVASASSASSGQYIPYEGNGGGPTLCADGMISNSSGRGTCSHHGGISGGGSTRGGGGGGSHHSSGGHSSGGHSSGGHSRRK